MDDWDSAAASEPAAVVNKWEGEDEDDGGDAPDSWDAEPEEPKAKGPEVVVEKKKAVTKRALAKKEEEERRLAEKMAAAQLNDPNFSAAERERLKRLEEDRDAALAGDLFGAESIKPKEASSDLPGSAKAGGASASASAAAASSSSSASSVDATAVASPTPVVPNSALKSGARIEEVALETDGDVDKFVSEVGKRLEKLGKSALASKKIGRLIASLTDEAIKLGVLRLDDVGELKRVMTVKHNDMTTKMKKADKKGGNKQAAAKPVVTLARNAFMHGSDYGSHADENPDDYDFI